MVANVSDPSSPLNLFYLSFKYEVEQFWRNDLSPLGGDIKIYLYVLTHLSKLIANVLDSLSSVYAQQSIIKNKGLKLHKHLHAHLKFYLVELKSQLSHLAWPNFDNNSFAHN